MFSIVIHFYSNQGNDSILTCEMRQKSFPLDCSDIGLFGDPHFLFRRIKIQELSDILNFLQVCGFAPVLPSLAQPYSSLSVFYCCDDF